LNEILAYHEAGHAVVKGLIGQEFENVKYIDTNLSKQQADEMIKSIPKARGKTVVRACVNTEHKVGVDTNSNVYLMYELMSLMGGMVAEEIRFKQSYIDGLIYRTMGKLDMLEAKQVSRKLVVNLGKPKIELSATSLIKLTYELVYILIDDHKDLLEEVAKLLISKKYVSGEEFQKIFKTNYISAAASKIKSEIIDPIKNGDDL
jgi:hypothetical protein